MPTGEKKRSRAPAEDAAGANARPDARRARPVPAGSRPANADLSASEQGHEDYDSAAGLFRALSHPLRVKIVCGLIQEPINQTGIARLLGLSPSLVAQHLAVLRRAGLVRGRRNRGEVILEVVDGRLPAIFAAVCGDAGRFLSSGWEGVSRRWTAGKKGV